MPQQPNILLIVTDQWRGDCMGILGHPDVDTPNLDNIFSKGTVFTRAYSAVPSCIAARASLLTGLSQKTHGRVGYKDGVRWDYPVTLPGVLADAGYHTHCVGKMHVSPARNLMGFHSVDLHDGYLGYERKTGLDCALYDDYLPWLKERCGQDADYTDTGLGCNGYSVAPWPYPENYHPTNWVTSRAAGFMKRRDPSKPFFLKVSYHRPHPPLDPPAWCLERYRDRVLSPPNIGEWAKNRLLPDKDMVHPVPASSGQIDLARKAYYAQLTHIDQQINRIIQRLNEDNVLANTLIVFLSDHGEMLYDHNCAGKTVPYDASIRIPFMIRFPEEWPLPDAGRVDKPVELRDVMPTLLEAAGVEVPDTVEGKSVLGLSGGGDTPWREYIHGEHCSHVSAVSNHWISDGKEIYIWFPDTGREQYFNLEEDISNMVECADKNPGRVKCLREKLVDELTGREEGYVKDGKLVKGRKSAPVLSMPGRSKP